MTHAVQRALERYGLHLNQADMSSVLTQIDSGKAGFVGRRRGGAQCWEVTVHGKLCRVIVHEEKGKRFVKTFLDRGKGRK